MSGPETSLITGERIQLAACALAAIAIPAWLLTAAPDVPGEAFAIADTPLKIASIEQPVDALAAPLFNPAREAPAADEGGNMTAPDAADPAAAQPAAVPRLVGVIVGRGTPGLVLARGGDGQTRLLHAGDMIDGWQLRAISATGATFDMGGRTERVGLDFAQQKPAEAAAPAEAASPDPRQPDSPTGR